ncbi:MAG TPA: DUF4272 domain-containing protein, partial [Sphingomicrobium sp.]|nr:DUF4272 domain-containing protein [Sphingomicrobium sp.]
MDPKDLRTATLRRLTAANIHPPPHFPLLDEPNLRRADEAIDRLFCLAAVAAVAYGFPREHARSWLEQEGLWPKLEGEEEEFLVKPTGATALFEWQVQGIFILAWALGVLDSLDFWKPCPNDLVLKLPDIMSSQPTGEIRGALALRP